MSIGTHTPRSGRPSIESTPSWVRWIGDAPWAATATWICLIALVLVDLELLKPAIAKAVAGSTAANWIAAFGIVCVMAGVLACAAELLMRFVERRNAAWLVGASLLTVAWVAAIVVLFHVREKFNDPPKLTGSSLVQTPSDSKVLWAALVLSLLMALTGLVAAALVVIDHDHRQAQRRRSARRRWMLATLHRWVSWQLGRHTSRTTMWDNRVKDLAARKGQQEVKITQLATGLEQTVRVRIATALAEPSATSGIFHSGNLRHGGHTEGVAT